MAEHVKSDPNKLEYLIDKIWGIASSQHYCYFAPRQGMTLIKDRLEHYKSTGRVYDYEIERNISDREDKS